ncbi:helix-turn-helix domain-containing protein [Vogesella indigofera]|uniref:Helix-turn-helix domain-containing protein n=1 Tax=Vogesella indigofera TaxID=45465 RepID=A0ABT5I5L5_VOGIN|nr:helix-turn-helix domain-containing protein [Vogesella indigofera]MDC7691455.1 helix-turn-helix domain-containing protein [Vogesella indigofera]
MMQHYSTSAAAPAERHRRWQEIIGQTYFNLQLDFLDPARFEGDLSCWQLGQQSLSRLSSGPLSYRRVRGEMHDTAEEQFLVSLPRQSTIFFSQMGREAHCGAGHFILERSNDPYEFHHTRANNLWVLKIPGHLLRARLRNPERYCAVTFDGSHSIGALFADYLGAVGRRLEQGDDCLHPLVGQQLLELFVAATEGNPAVLDSQASCVRAAHLNRIERYVRANLADTRLAPEQIAGACRISVRYLHDLFRDTGQTFGLWLREQRLAGARQALGSPQPQTLAQLAYQWGFTDQSHFSRVFKQRYGCTPREERERLQAARLGKAH